MGTFVDRNAAVNSANAWKAPCRVAATGPIALSGLQTIDGITLAANDFNLRVLVNGQSDESENGIYDAKSGAWTRATDLLGNSDVLTGTLLSVVDGDAASGFYAMNRLWTLGTSVIGTDAIAFAAFQF